jgi:hypothetical protein
VWALRDTVASRYPGATCLFLNGCAGNINPARFPYEPRANIYIPQTEENYPVYWGGLEDTIRMGSSLGNAAIAAAESGVVLDIPAVEGTRQAVELPLKAGDDLGAFLEFMNFRNADYANRLRGMDAFPTEVQRLRIGDLSIVGLPGEPFVEIGLAIKAAGAGRPLLVTGYSNDDVRYVLTDDAYDGGQYETVGTPLRAGSAPALVEAATRLL